MGDQPSRDLPGIVISRSAGDDPQRRRFEDALIGRLGTDAPCPVLVVPHVYHLNPSGPVARRLADVVARRDDSAAPLVVGAWLYPRATAWTLAALGCAEADKVFAVDLRDAADPDGCAAALVAMAGADAAAAPAVEHLGSPGDPRWYPVLDYDRCVACRQCLDFCLFGVYALDADDRVVATQPDNCKPGCPACARVCPAKAIMFPQFAGSAAIAGADADARPDEAPSVPAPAVGDDARRDDLDDLIDTLDRLDDD